MVWFLLFKSFIQKIHGSFKLHHLVVKFSSHTNKMIMAEPVFSQLSAIQTPSMVSRNTQPEAITQFSIFYTKPSSRIDISTKQLAPFP